MKVVRKYALRGAGGIAVALMSLTSASYAGISESDCCGDIEQRLAELEATAARKGNSRVRLTISGWVNEAIFAWDDGVERNTYIGTNELEQTRVRFGGEAKIGVDLTLGYTLEVGANGAGSKTFDQDFDGKSAVVLRKSAWFVNSAKLGKVTVGRFETATWHLIDNVDTTLTRYVSDFEAAGAAIAAFKTLSNGVTGPKWTDIMGGFNNATPGQSGIRNVVRYDSPEFVGFTASVSWGEDDEWATAFRYKGALNEFKVAASIGYGESTDSAVNAAQCKVGSGDCQWWGLAGSIIHSPTGLFVIGGYGENKIELKPADLGKKDSSETWYVQGGIENKWLTIGKTNVFIEYRQDDVGLSNAADSSHLAMWAGGLVQFLDEANLTMYAIYRHYDGDHRSASNTIDLDPFDTVILGAKFDY